MLTILFGNGSISSGYNSSSQPFNTCYRLIGMRKLIIIVSVIVSIISCRKESSDPMKDLPICIQSLIDSGKEETIKTIRVQTNNGIVHYWLNTDASTWDGIESIVDKDCNNVCYICGECLPPECIDDYDFDKWQIIWKL